MPDDAHHPFILGLGVGVLRVYWGILGRHQSRKALGGETLSGQDVTTQQINGVGQEGQYVACGDSRGLRGVLDGATESVYRVNCRNLHRSGSFRNLLCICHSTAEEE